MGEETTVDTQEGAESETLEKEAQEEGHEDAGASTEQAEDAAE